MRAGGSWEARLIRERLYRDQQAGLELVLPVVLPGCSPPVCRSGWPRHRRRITW